MSYGLLEHCVVCGEPLEPDAGDHHCDPQKEQKLAVDPKPAKPHEPTEAERLATGFQIMSMGGDRDE